MSDRELENLFQSYIDNELDEKDRSKIENYLNQNLEAKKIFENLQNVNKEIKDAYKEYANHPSDEFINSLIKNYTITDRSSTNFSLTEYIKELINKFSFVNFASGAAIASILGFFAFNIHINTSQYASLDNNINKLYFNNSTKNNIENLLNQNNQSVASKIKDLENILNNENFINQIPKLTEKGNSKLDKQIINLDNLIFEVAVSEDDKNCIKILVQYNDEKLIKYFCYNNNKWELVK